MKQVVPGHGGALSIDPKVKVALARHELKLLDPNMVTRSDPQLVCTTSPCLMGLGSGWAPRGNRMEEIHLQHLIYSISKSEPLTQDEG